MVYLIDVRGLDENDVKLLESLADSLREKAKIKKAAAEKEAKDGFKKSAGSWKGLIDPEELIANIYSSRLVSSRAAVKL
jgi:hypothetical protein